jgi:Ca2+-binding EF-hand superfamily protein
MAEITKSEFINKMIDELNQMDEMKECKYSVNDVAEALFREATKNSNSDTITREKFDAIDEVKISLIVGFFISDKDKSGFVDKAELKFYLNDVLGMGDVSDEDLKELLNSIDTDAEVKLSLDEFTKVIFKKSV